MDLVCNLLCDKDLSGRENFLYFFKNILKWTTECEEKYNIVLNNKSNNYLYEEEYNENCLITATMRHMS